MWEPTAAFFDSLVLMQLSAVVKKTKKEEPTR